MNDRRNVVQTDDSEALLNEIGQLLAQDREYSGIDTLLYSEVGHDYIGESIFKILDDRFLYRRPFDRRLPYALLELWEAQDGNYRWSELEYVLRDGRFEVNFFYPDEIDPEEDLTDRRARSVRRHFGDKPIVYPPWDPHDFPTYEM
jgi:hypothetical protein